MPYAVVAVTVSGTSLFSARPHQLATSADGERPGLSDLDDGALCFRELPPALDRSVLLEPDLQSAIYYECY